jgi:heme/copper-type cytochrome/quinol oxidase subunit 1
MSSKLAKYFIISALCFLLLSCLEGVMFPTKFQMQSLYKTLLHVPPGKLKAFFGYFVTKIHTHVSLIGWVSSALMGILYHVAPQISGRERYLRWAGYGNWACHVLGLLLVITGFHLIGVFGLASGFDAGSPEFRAVAAPYRALVAAGGVLVTVSALLFSCNMLRTLLAKN